MNNGIRPLILVTARICLLTFFVSIVACASSGYLQTDSGANLRDALEDLSALVHAGRLTNNSDLLCQAETFADKCISIVETSDTQHRGLDVYQSIKRRLAK